MEVFYILGGSAILIGLAYWFSKFKKITFAEYSKKYDDI